MADASDDTVELRNERSFAELFFAPGDSPLVLQPAAATHVGRVRRSNEDHYAVVRQTRSREILLTNLPGEAALPTDEAYALVVADGVGGAASGDVASRLALQTMFELLGRATSWVMKFTDLEAQEIQHRVEAYVKEIQKTLRGVAEQNPRLEGMGTTWTSAHIIGPHAIVVQIGDSRAYRFRDSHLRLITHDQTLAQEMVDAGLAEEDVQRFRHVLTNSFGGGSDDVRATIDHLHLRSGDRLLLCSDGLSDMVERRMMANVLESHTEPQAACDRLVQLALEAGGKDNITVILCDVRAAER